MPDIGLSVFFSYFHIRFKNPGRSLVICDFLHISGNTRMNTGLLPGIRFPDYLPQTDIFSLKYCRPADCLSIPDSVKYKLFPAHSLQKPFPWSAPPTLLHIHLFHGFCPCCHTPSSYFWNSMCAEDLIYAHFPLNKKRPISIRCPGE